MISKVTAEADRQVMMSPALGDFLQLRYVDLGPRPDPAGDLSGPVRRIVADLMTAQETAGRSHFALIVIAKSAMTIEELLGSCAAEPFLARLRMRFAGIASIDDRQHGNRFADIRVHLRAAGGRRESSLTRCASGARNCHVISRPRASPG